MQVLTTQLKAKYPGMVIYGIGDTAHQGSMSGHNEDDTAGSRPEDHDADSNPEHRALDLMIGRPFPVSEAWRVVSAMVAYQENQRRLLYVIFMRKIWRRATGWVEETYTQKDPHTNHVHISGEADDDENVTPWVLEKLVPVKGKGFDVEMIYAVGRGWARVGSVFQPLTTQSGADVNAVLFGDAERKTAEYYDALKATYAPEDVREPI